MLSGEVVDGTGDVTMVLFAGESCCSDSENVLSAGCGCGALLVLVLCLEGDCWKRDWKNVRSFEALKGGLGGVLEGDLLDSEGEARKVCRRCCEIPEVAEVLSSNVAQMEMRAMLRAECTEAPICMQCMVKHYLMHFQVTARFLKTQSTSSEKSRAYQ